MELEELSFSVSVSVSALVLWAEVTNGEAIRPLERRVVVVLPVVVESVRAGAKACKEVVDAQQSSASVNREEETTILRQGCGTAGTGGVPLGVRRQGDSDCCCCL
jgi:hypothetical protein